MNASDGIKYLIIKKKPSDDVFESVGSIQKASAQGVDHDPRIEFDTAELNRFELQDAINDPAVKDVIPSIPFTLIRPVASETNSDVDHVWGIEAIGAQDCDYTIPQVTVAVLDTGIGRKHDAFKGVTLVLKDFSKDAKGVDDQATDTDGHGTHCAGTMFGRALNGKRIGVAPGIQRALIGNSPDQLKRIAKIGKYG